MKKKARKLIRKYQMRLIFSNCAVGTQFKKFELFPIAGTR